MTAPAPTPGQAVFTWDYRQPAPMDEIAAAVRELSGGAVRMSMPETGGDQYELVVARGNGERPAVYACFLRTSYPRLADHEIADAWGSATAAEAAFWRKLEALAGGMESQGYVDPVGIMTQASAVTVKALAAVLEGRRILVDVDDAQHAGGGDGMWLVTPARPHDLAVQLLTAVDKRLTDDPPAKPS